MKFGKSFTYNGMNTKVDFNMITAFTGNGDDTMNLGLTREIVKGETTKFRPSANHLGTKYSDVLSFPITLIKNNTDNQNDMIITREELRKITAWLSSPQLPQLLHFEDYNDTDEHIDYFGLFTEITPFVSENKIYGVQLTFTASSQYGFTEMKTFTCDPDSSVVIDNTSDEWEDCVYPVLQITPLETDTITISNETDNNSLKIKVNKGNDLTIDCANLMITDKAGIVMLSDIGISVDDLDSLYWFRLIHGKNTISITGQASANISCRFLRKVGEY